ncbi:hypothetical protein BUY92_00445 [Staphylococcus equorum]|uniref:hypothetical protein n=1 Tax=Staphylococcus equorum TaxID=246432 RepID=UPI000D1CA772|nr:hypothetical protein [Staphylococcus equorum]MEB7853065.1 hypothetical protein [Staphylococcus equorum]PTE26150.1 hypothetical protein BUY92_00445 [Staphylococcus equorum]PTE31488.1 hypothetical protein BUY83_02085 [Staphylococcus equorum]QQB59687.1 hypothetical protein I6I25_12960 [Staphylococcus equorum]
MDKQHIKEALNKHSEIIIETIEHDRITVKKIEDNDDDQYLHILEPKDQKVEIAKIKDLQENNFNQL